MLFFQPNHLYYFKSQKYEINFGEQKDWKRRNGSTCLNPSVAFNWVWIGLVFHSCVVTCCFVNCCLYFRCFAFVLKFVRRLKVPNYIKRIFFVFSKNAVCFSDGLVLLLYTRQEVQQDISCEVEIEPFNLEGFLNSKFNRGKFRILGFNFIVIRGWTQYFHRYS